MQIDKDTVVSFDYVLTDDSGKTLDSSEGRAPLSYLHGAAGIIPGLENALTGKQAGDELNVRVAPADGYGERNDALCQVVQRSEFASVENLQVGMQFQVQSDAGPMVVTVTNVTDTEVTIDANHPLAGVSLNFAVTIREVRDATPEEIQHGHVHGPDSH